MPVHDTPPVWKMIRDAVHALGGKTTNTAVRDWILEHYPDTHRGTIGCQTIICTVNHPSRVHYQQNKKPRRANAQYDFLMRTGRGCLELYSPQRHGAWEIVEKSNGALAIRQTSSPSTVVAALAKCQSSNGNSGAGFGH